MNDRDRHEPLSDLLDDLGRNLSSSPAPALAPCVVGALRHRRRARLARGVGATLACALAVGLAAWSLGIFTAPRPPSSAAIITADASPRQEPLPPSLAKLTVGYLSASSRVGGAEVSLPEEAALPDIARPLGPRSAAEMLRGL